VRARSCGPLFSVGSLFLFLVEEAARTGQREALPANPKRPPASVIASGLTAQRPRRPCGGLRQLLLTAVGGCVFVETKRVKQRTEPPSQRESCGQRSRGTRAGQPRAATARRRHNPPPSAAVCSASLLSSAANSTPCWSECERGRATAAASFPRSPACGSRRGSRAWPPKVVDSGQALLIE
jgi:hypothetical protein